MTVARTQHASPLVRERTVGAGMIVDPDGYIMTTEQPVRNIASTIDGDRRVRWWASTISEFRANVRSRARCAERLSRNSAVPNYPRNRQKRPVLSRDHRTAPQLRHLPRSRQRRVWAHIESEGDILVLLWRVRCISTKREPA